MKQFFCVGDRVDVDGALPFDSATVIGVNEDGTVNVVWDLGGYTYNLDTAGLTKIEEEV